MLSSILVGHSFGGLNMYLYALQYPDEVAGLVLIDALSKNIGLHSPSEFHYYVSWNRMKFRALSLLTRLGLARLFLQLKGIEGAQTFLKKLPSDVQRRALAANLRKTFHAAAAESEAMAESVALAHATQATLNIPLVVITHGIPDMFIRRMSVKEVEHAERTWQKIQAELASLSSQGKLVIADKAGHKVHIDQPELVVEAIRQIVQENKLSP